MPPHSEHHSPKSEKKRTEKLEYEEIKDVQKAELKFFREWSPDALRAFFESFTVDVEPGHLSAYRLCALAGMFPSALVKDKSVISSREIVFSRFAYEREEGWTREIMEMRDRLVLFVKGNRTLLEKAQKALSK